MIKCGLCGKEFEDNQFDEYAAHVKKCAYDHKIKADTEKMKKINAELEEVKRAKTCYEGLRDAFKEKYPDIYKANFGENKEEYKSKKNKYNTTFTKDNHNLFMKDIDDLENFINYLSFLYKDRSN